MTNEERGAFKNLIKILKDLNILPKDPLNLTESDFQKLMPPEIFGLVLKHLQYNDPRFLDH